MSGRRWPDCAWVGPLPAYGAIRQWRVGGSWRLRLREAAASARRALSACRARRRVLVAGLSGRSALCGRNICATRLLVVVWSSGNGRVEIQGNLQELGQALFDLRPQLPKPTRRRGPSPHRHFHRAALRGLLTVIGAPTGHIRRLCHEFGWRASRRWKTTAEVSETRPRSKHWSSSSMERGTSSSAWSKSRRWPFPSHAPIALR